MSVNINHPQPCPSCGGLWRHYEGCVDAPVAEQGFTPGPWHVHDEVPLRFGDCSLSHQIWSDVTRIGFIEEQNVGAVAAEANARLIAAAPGLYTFLRKIYLDYEDDCRCEHNNENCCAVVGESCARCHAFIALALVDGPQKNADEGA